jgi:hypothetical protein
MNDDNYHVHNNAAVLIIAAAKKSGLLDEIAAVLCCIDKTDNPSSGCRACELLDDLADAFDEHVCLAALTLEKFHGEGSNIPRYTEEELRPHFFVPFDMRVVINPPRFDIDFNKIDASLTTATSASV